MGGSSIRAPSGLGVVTSAREVLVRPGRLVRLLAVVDVLLAFSIVVVLAGPTGPEFADGLSDAALLGLVAAVGVIVFPIRVEVTATRLDIVNAVSIWRMTRASIQEARAEDGLRIALADGRSIGVNASPASILGAIRGYRHARNAQARVQMWISEGLEPGASAHVVRAVRWGAVLAFLYMPCITAGCLALLRVAVFGGP